jgi:hypothetical protein
MNPGDVVNVGQRVGVEREEVNPGQRHAVLTAATFFRDAGSRVIDENPAHRLRRQGKEVRR